MYLISQRMRGSLHANLLTRQGCACNRRAEWATWSAHMAVVEKMGQNEKDGELAGAGVV